MKLKKEWLARLQNLEGTRATRLPEINLVRPIGRQTIEPIFIGYPDPKLQACLLTEF